MKPRCALAVAVGILAGTAVTGFAASILDCHGSFCKEKILEKELLSIDGQDAGQMREVIHMPQGYGPLLTVTSSGIGPMLWYQDDQGHIRNVNLIDAVQPMMIQSDATVTPY